MFKRLNPILHSELRLAIVSLLSTVESATFSYLKEETNASSGNLSIQIKKLQEKNYIRVKKEFDHNYPKTTCSITKKGRTEFENYIDALKDYIKQ